MSTEKKREIAEAHQTGDWWKVHARMRQESEEREAREHKLDGEAAESTFMVGVKRAKGLAVKLSKGLVSEEQVRKAVDAIQKKRNRPELLSHAPSLQRVDTALQDLLRYFWDYAIPESQKVGRAERDAELAKLGSAQQSWNDKPEHVREQELAKVGKRLPKHSWGG